MASIDTSSGQSRTIRALAYVLALLLVLLAPLLGLMAAMVGTWHALQAGSFWYMPLGLVLLLAAVALAQNHKPLDLALLGLLLVATIAWFQFEPLQQVLWLDAFWVLTNKTGWMISLLLMSAVALALIYAARRLR